MEHFPSTIIELFKWLGTPAFAGIFVSFLLEHWTGFQELGADYKAIIVFVATGLLGILSYALVTYVPGELINALEPWFGAFVAAGMAFLGSQYFHRSFNKAPAEIVITSEGGDGGDE